MMESYTSGFHVSLALRDPSPASRFAPFRHTPILMLSSIHSTTPLRFGPDEDYLPVDAFLEKSAGPAALVALVTRWLAGAGSRRGPWREVPGREAAARRRTPRRSPTRSCRAASRG